MANKLNNGQQSHARNESSEYLSGQQNGYNIDVMPNSANWQDKLKLQQSPRETTDQIEKINHFLEVDGLFWDRDSHGLFDYECKNL